MKRAAAVAMSVVVLMTSGVTAKAAVTDAQPAKNSSEAYLKWANQITTGYDTLSEIKVVGKYIYAADDSQHRIIKINKDTGKIEKEHKYHDESYTQYYVGNIGYGDGKVYVAYATEGTENNGRIEAFDAQTLEPVWITEKASHVEKDEESGEEKTVYDVIASKLVYDDGHLYYGTGTGTPGSSYGWDKVGTYYVLDTKDEDTTKTDEIKNAKEVISTSDEGNFYLKNAVKAGKYMVSSDTKGQLFTIDQETSKVVATKEFNEVFSGGIAYDQTTSMIYFVVGTNDLYGVKINSDGTFGDSHHVKVYESGYSTMTPEVYNGKVYLTGSKGSNGLENNGYFAVVDVRSNEYKVNYTVDIPAYSQGEMLVSKTGENSVRLYFTVNTAKTDENYNVLSGGGIYSIEDKQGATSSKLETVYEPEQKYANYCMSSVFADEDGILYYSNDSKTIFAVGKKAADVVKPATPAKKITKTQTSTRTVKLTWKKNKSAKGYVIYAKAGKGKYKKLTTVGKTTKKTVKVKAGTSYKFKVKPYKYTKKNGKNVKKYYKAYKAKAKFGSKTVKVVYKNVTGYTSYRIDMKVGNGSYKKVLTSKKTGTLTLTYTKKNAKVGKSYKFRLVGIKKVNGKTVEKTIK